MASTPTHTNQYDVFICFRGEDTRDNLTTHLYASLCKNNILAFIDDNLTRGEEISPSLFKAIEESKLSVIIFSPDYASSRWCLEELSKIMECKRKNGQLVIPLFYGVNPSHVRNQTGSFADAFVKHEQVFKKQVYKVQSWRESLREAANISGWVLQGTRGELDSEFVEKVAVDILNLLRNMNQMSNKPRNGRIRKTITEWEKGRFLGLGWFGPVYEGISNDGFFFAVKEISLLNGGSPAQESAYQLEQEIGILSELEHENIVQYHGTQKDSSNLYIFFEYVSMGNLVTLYQKYHLRDTQVSAYTRQILLGLKYLHDQNVVHRDLKCENILVAASGSVKITGMGFAKATKWIDVRSIMRSAFWMAPEVVNHKNHSYGLPSDIWSVGCTVLEMLTSSIPYSELEPVQALFKIARGIPPDVPDFLSNNARDFILQSIQVNPEDRPSAALLLDHPFVKR
ncbi:hypothetical protein Tsubulata_045267 [Turnera subulata]|uniref:Protein kinase domain-containing protein n=1 Tax=Turnera subulata TaxID=218843 RepID=A0A9Q0JC24_9ROSI|nr:hypothetical protein Tsubulata_045267 [Turnera subulata]